MTYIVGQMIRLKDVITDSDPSNPRVSLMADLTAGATSVSISEPFGPGTSFTIKIDSEYMTVTGGFGTVTLTVTRAANGSIAAAHTAGTKVLAYIDDSTDAVTVYKPDGTTAAPTPISHPTLATYMVSYTLDQAGWHEYVWRATGAAFGARRGSFFVSPVP